MRGCTASRAGTAHVEEGPLQSGWVVVDVVGAEGEHAYEEEQQEAVQPAPRVHGKERLTAEPGAGGRARVTATTQAARGHSPSFLAGAGGGTPVTIILVIAAGLAGSVC